ncbi:rhamnulokinase [Streptomyces sp. TLI_053]|nr:rhamnulokinase [Streptomyces sp. TLI_053]
MIVGHVGRSTLELVEANRFDNTPLRLPTGLHWDLPALYTGILTGLRAAHQSGPLASVGIDSWAVDYGFLDADGALLGLPHHYRDPRTLHIADQVRDRAGASHLYQTTGLQHLPFNTVFQLAAARGTALLDAARTLLLVPDLLAYWLTGNTGAEATNASTTGLLDAITGTWSPDLARLAGIDESLLPPVREPGSIIGTLLPHVATATGLPAATPVVAVASHDTASAIVAVPATEPNSAYISCGTWSLAGLELDKPVLTDASRAANFTNERGIDGTVRYLRNIMGMWLLEECRRSWTMRRMPSALVPLLAEAAGAEPFAAVIDPDAPDFLAPEDMPDAIARYCVRTGQRPPASQGATVRCILESLALAHRRTLRAAAELAGQDITHVHMVGGGSRNELLCQFTADATGLPVVAGPAEATALGNVLVQARAHGLLGDLVSMRRLVADTQPLRRYRPQGDQRIWDSLEERLS